MGGGGEGWVSSDGSPWSRALGEGERGVSAQTKVKGCHRATDDSLPNNKPDPLRATSSHSKGYEHDSTLIYPLCFCPSLSLTLSDETVHPTTPLFLFPSSPRLPWRQLAAESPLPQNSFLPTVFATLSQCVCVCVQ